MPLDIRPALGHCEIKDDSVRINNPGYFGFATLTTMPLRCKVAATIKFDAGCQSFGVVLKLLDDLDTCYYVRFEPANNRMVFDRWPRPGDVPYMTGLERPLTLTPGEPIEVEVVVDGTIAEIYVSGKVAMSTRMYSPSQGRLGLFVDQGNATFERLGVYSMLG